MKKNRVVKEIFWWVRSLALGVIIAIILNTTVFANAVVISGSMENTIMTDSRVFGTRLAYIFNEPERFDVILFDDPNNKSDIPLLKRIIGLPNETVEIIDGKVYINGSDTALDDSFIKEEARGSFGPFDVPEGCYFVLGDNRNYSHDSKNWVNSFVSIENILGKVFIVYYPTPKIF